MSGTRYTAKELIEMSIADLLTDAKCSERQAKEGPFYPERGITPESCEQYAKTCREEIVQLTAKLQTA